MRRPTAVLALAGLLLTPSIAASSDYDNFNKAYDKGDYAKAAKLAIAMGADGKSVRALERFGDACAYAGRVPEAVGFKVERLFRAEFHQSVTSAAVFNEARSIARLALQASVRPEDTVVGAITSVESGDTLAGVRVLHEQYARRSGVVGSLCGDALKAYVFPALEAALLRGDGTQAAQLARCRPSFTPAESRGAVLAALETGGDIAEAVRQAYADVFTGQNGSGPYTYAGNPALLPIAAQIAHRHHHTSDIPLVAAYAMHLAGDTQGAIAAVELIADSALAGGINDTVCVARFLAGDLRRAHGDLRRALSWYHRVTWSDFEHWEARYLSPSTYKDAQYPTQADYFHRILGGVRQASVLLAQGRPKLALEELSALVDMDPEVRENVNGNSTLRSEWKATSEAISARFAADPGGGVPSETLDSLGYYADDWVFDDSGQKSPRRAARIVLETMVAQHAARQQWITNVQTSSEYQAFLESQEQAQAEAEAAKNSAGARSSNARGQAFQFDQRARSNVCVRCKGSGSLYVPPSERQGWKYSEVDKQVLDTKIYTSAHMVKCHWCDGTGKR